VEGLRDLLRQPEFHEGERLLRLLEAMAEHNLSKAIPAPAGPGDVSIIIGGEHPIDEMRACSVISTRYDGPSGLRGTLSVVGPTRMHYPRNVAAVRYMSSLMEELLRVYFA
jgi:heat-inducible transcriptional repressor